MQFASLLVVFGLIYPVWAGMQESGSTPGIQQAIADLQRGDFSSAEQKLRAEIAIRPDDAWALSLLAATLDNLKRSPEAETLHQQAIQKAPRSPEVLNNYAVHLWLSGDEAGAAKIYRRIVAVDPAHSSANLQLARFALQQKNGRDALAALDRLPADQQEKPESLLPRLQALYLCGDSAGAETVTRRLSEMAHSDANLSFAVAVTLSNAGQFAQAEGFFEAGLARDPANFEALYDLGIAATRAGHLDRAREALQSALRQQPQNVDVLYALACADHALRQWETAVQLLSRAAKLDPKRADVQKMLAIATSDLGALDDAASAWERYLKLAPDDDVARRERGYTAAQKGQYEEAIDDLAWYVARHPNDVAGRYELGMAQRTTNLQKALEQFDRALALDPNYVPARTARGSLYYQQGKPEAAVPDLEKAAALRPEDAAVLDHLGQAYQALDRNAEALRALSRAAELAPADSKILLHLAKALATAGQVEESKKRMEQFRQLGPEKRSGVRAGFVEYLSLSDEERRSEYRARLEKAVRDHPDDATLQVEFLKLLIRDGDLARLPEVARGIAAREPAASALADVGRALIAGQQYQLASELLQQAAANGKAGAAADLELAVATFHLGEPAKALQMLDRILETSRDGNYYLSRAEVLDGAGDAAEARRALDRALSSTNPSPDLFRRAATLLLRQGKAADAVQILDRAAARFPQNRGILLLLGVASELAGRTDQAERKLAEIQNRWPEWYAGWAAQGVILTLHGKNEDGRKALALAARLGAPPAGFRLPSDGQPDLFRLFFLAPLDGPLP